MKTRVLLLLSLALASFARAQVSPEEAQRRMEERRAQAVTRPVDASVVPDLKFQIATLQREVARLKAENAALATRLADAQAVAAVAAAAASTRPAPEAPVQSDPPAPSTVPSATVKPSGKLRLGMTLQEANAAMGFDARLVGEGRGWQQYEWQLPGKPRPVAPAASDQRRTPSLLGGGNTDNPGPSIFARFEGGSLTSYAKR